jgi:hypothetical protein
LIDLRLPPRLRREKESKSDDNIRVRPSPPRVMSTAQQPGVGRNTAVPHDSIFPPSIIVPTGGGINTSLEWKIDINAG